MFYGQCWKCGERWGLGTASTCKCPEEKPQRTWVGLTDVEIVDIMDAELTTQNTEHFALCQAIEAKLKEKNT
jgi:hypothetical protein